MGSAAYGFDDQFDLGCFGEDRLREFRHEHYTLTKSTLEMEKQGIDFVFANRLTGKSWTIELKTDFKAFESRNAFIETISVDNATQHRAGWVYTSMAQILLYFIPQSGSLYILDLARLREQMPAFARRFQTVSTSSHRYGSYYRTHGILVPLTELAKLAHSTLELPIKLPPGWQSDKMKRSKLLIKQK